FSHPTSARHFIFSRDLPREQGGHGGRRSLPKRAAAGVENHRSGVRAETLLHYRKPLRLVKCCLCIIYNLMATPYGLRLPPYRTLMKPASLQAWIAAGAMSKGALSSPRTTAPSPLFSNLRRTDFNSAVVLNSRPPSLYTKPLSE